MNSNPLSWVLIVKIAFTTLVWGVPILLCRRRLLRSLGFVVPEPTLFLRLLGMAYIALVVSYGFGLQTSLRGGYPASVVWTGIISNGGAFMILVLNAKSGTWAKWEIPARALMWFSLVATGAITTGLIRFGLMAY